jgi:hypothetical protein
MYKESVFSTLRKLNHPNIEFSRRHLPLSIQLRRAKDQIVPEALLRSSYANEFGEQHFPIENLGKKRLNSENLSFYITNRIVLKICKEFEPTRIVTVNGRFVIDGAVVNIAKILELELHLLEATSENLGYLSISTISSQSVEENQKMINEVWKNRGEVLFRESGSRELENTIEFLRNKRKGYERKIVNATLGKKYVTFFPTSDYEFAAHDQSERKSFFFPNQVDAVTAVAECCRESNMTLIIRAHPHVKGSILGQKEDQIWGGFASLHGCEYIPSTSSVNSYELANNAHVNFTYISTIGAEIAWLGLPIGILGETPYSPYVPELQASSNNDVRKLILSPKILKDNLKLLPWAYFMSTGHTALEFIEMHSVDEILFNGENMVRVRKFTRPSFK